MDVEQLSMLEKPWKGGQNIGVIKGKIFKTVLFILFIYLAVLGLPC